MHESDELKALGTEERTYQLTSLSKRAVLVGIFTYSHHLLSSRRSRNCCGYDLCNGALFPLCSGDAVGFALRFKLLAASLFRSLLLHFIGVADRLFHDCRRRDLIKH